MDLQKTEVPTPLTDMGWQRVLGIALALTALAFALTLASAAILAASVMGSTLAALAVAWKWSKNKATLARARVAEWNETRNTEYASFEDVDFADVEPEPDPT